MLLEDPDLVEAVLIILAPEFPQGPAAVVGRADIGCKEDLPASLADPVVVFVILVPDQFLIIGLIAVLVCLILLLAVVAIVVTYVSRTALIGMVRQIDETEAVTISDGWRLGWSKGAWRLFLLNLLIGIPLAIISIVLILLAFSPLLLMFTKRTAFTVAGVVFTIFAVLFVILILILIGAVIGLPA